MRLVAQVEQFDANLGWFVLPGWIGPDADLRFGKEGVLGPVQGHGRPVELAEAADEFALHIALHVGDDLSAAQGLPCRRGHLQSGLARLIRAQGERDGVNPNSPPAQDIFGSESDSSPLRKRTNGERVRVFLAWDQGLPDINVALAALRLRTFLLQEDVNAPVTVFGRNPHHTALGRAVWRHFYVSRAHGSKRHANTKVGYPELKGHCVRDGIVVDYFGAQLSGTASDGRCGVNGDFLLGVPGPVAFRKGHGGCLRERKGAGYRV